MSLRQRLNQKAMPVSYGLPAMPPVHFMGDGIAIYPKDSGQKFIEKGYKLNDAVYSIVSKNADKASQVRLYHAKVKREERKTLHEYNALQKGSICPQVVKELNRMRKAMIDEYAVTSALSKLLNKPTRYQSQSEWLEMMILLRELQGEANLWKNRGAGSVAIEMLIIPKQHLILKGNMNDPWDVQGYQFVLNGATYNWKKEDVVMWKYSNPTPLDSTFEHMRGMAPLEAARVLMQAMNEGDVSIAAANHSRGASGFAYAKNIPSPSTEQKAEMRRQFNDAINNEEMANKIAILAGEWGYYNIGQTLDELKSLEQYGVGFKRLCRVFKTPAQIFDEGNGTWDNQKQAYRHWIYSKIAPMVYNCRGVLNDALLKEFSLDPERDIIDCDIMSLPEMATEVGDKADAMVKLSGTLSVNERRIELGYEPLPGAEYDHVPSEDIGGGLEDDLKQLEE
jgi:HK97 family phage portal protein